MMDLTRQEILKGVKEGKISVAESVALLEQAKNRKNTLESIQQNSTIQYTDPSIGISSNDTNNIKERIERNIIQIIAKITETPARKIRIDENIGHLGMDSLGFKELANQLSQYIGVEIAPNLFFQYSTVSQISEYMIENYRDKLVEYYSSQIQKKAVNTEAVTNSKQLSDVKEIKKTVPQVVDNDADEPIAIIGMSGLFPGSEDLEQYWKNLVEQKSMISEIPPERWDYRKYYSDKPGHKDKVSSKWAGLISDVDSFDARFFGITPKDAELTDPQHRLFLQTVWHALEDAGFDFKLMNGRRVGVFVGAQFNDYSMLLGEHESTPGAVTGNSHALIANRVSYFLNLHGSSESIDTACSSSLVALHHAVNSIRNGDDEMAIVGGVSLMLSPKSLLAAGKLGILSPEGKCKTFSKDADGYVKGEGIAAIVIKRLSQAQADNDHIYAVIRATGENHGGTAQSLTAPNPEAQSELISRVLRKAKISPDTITYIESHGTGTELGDPIEIDALKKAFEMTCNSNVTSNKNVGWCSLGSVKANIGHLEPAAGIAGVIKVALALKHKIIPGLVNFTQLNPYIDIENSPFRIDRSTKQWTHLNDINGREIPLRAGVSSFGFGGTNAHAILEEYSQNDDTIKQEQKLPKNIFVLSAKNDERLKESARLLLEWLKTQSENLFNNIAYTLQIGRLAMSNRLAIIADSKKMLEQRLEKWIEGNYDDGIFAGKAYEDNRDSIAVGDDLPAMAKAWVSGSSIEWKQLYKNCNVCKVSMPTYPFEKTHYWVKSSKAKSESCLHPLVHRNLSGLNNVIFETDVSNDICFVNDHGSAIPAAMYIEMVRYAAEFASRDRRVASLRRIVLKALCFARENSKKVSIELLGKNNVSFVINSNDNGKNVANVTGEVIFETQSSQITQPFSYNVKDIINRCTGGKSASDEYYDTIHSFGLQLGESVSGLDELYSNENEALSVLRLAPSLEGGRKDFVLHPTLVDGGIQSAVAWAYQHSISRSNMYVPFCIDEVTIINRNSLPRYAYITHENTGNDEKFNIDLLDVDGQAAIIIRGLVIRPVKNSQDNIQKKGCFLLSPMWIKSNINCNESLSSNESILLLNSRSTSISDVLSVQTGIALSNISSVYRDDMFENGVFSEDKCQSLIESLFKSRNEFSYIIDAWSLDDMDTSYDECLQRAFCILREIIRRDARVKIQFLFVYPLRKDTQPQYRAMGAFCRTVMFENTGSLCKAVGIENVQSDSIASAIKNEMIRMSDGAEVEYRTDGRFVKIFDDFTLPSKNNGFRFDKGSVYLITGGTGALGLLVAERLANETPLSTIVLAVHHQPNDAQNDRIEMLKKKCAEVRVVITDMNDADSVNGLLQEVYEKDGRLDGVIHCAGYIYDSRIPNKTLNVVKGVVAPKVYGVINMERAISSYGLHPAFFVMFSSAAGSFGNMGQCDYSFANNFLNEYSIGKDGCSCKYISIGWPLWKDGGMRPDNKTQQLIEEHTGMFQMATEDGMRIFIDCIRSGITGSIVVLFGEYAKIKKTLGINSQNINNEIKEKEISSISEDDPNSLILGELYNTLLSIFNDLTSIDVEELKECDIVSELGVTSITFVELAEEINARYALDVTPAYFFNFSTLTAMAEGLLEDYTEKISAAYKKTIHKYSDESEDEFISDNMDDVNDTIADSDSDVNVQNDIAIIGMSGLMPGSSDLESFWEKIEASVNLVQEIPEERWDWKKYYGNPNTEPGKTNIKYGSFVPDYDKFDPTFFSILPSDAEQMDPQERKMIELVWAAIENAGYPVSSLAGTDTSLFIGVSNQDYCELMCKNNYQMVLGHFMLVNRISFLLDIHGYSEPINTACSSSLVAIHRAVEAIRSGKSHLAIAGGINLMFTPNLHISSGKTGVLSTDGSCKTFDEAANGYVRGEGGGAILLKPLNEAIRDNDHIYAVIKGTAVNHGGHASSLTAPNSRMQSAVVVEAYTNAKVDPSTVSYIETHGTGTKIGDPIEIDGLKKAFAELYARNNKVCKAKHIGLGSVKSNIGHLESGAGIAGLFKIILAMEHETLPELLHFKKLNPYINLDDSPFYIVDSKQSWNRLKDANGNEIPRRAGVSSFGIGGVNSHIVVEEYINPKPSPCAHLNNLYIVSAKNVQRLREYASLLADAIDDSCFESAAYTLQNGRDEMNERLAVIASSSDQLKETIQNWLNGKTVNNVFTGTVTQAANGDEFIASRDQLDIAAQRWVNGVHINWNGLYRSPMVRIPLPTYPFEKERYWIETCEQISNTVLHPLVHSNVSTIWEQRFSTEFSGNEYYLDGHRIGGYRILPGVVMIEMARASASLACEKKVHNLSNIMIMKPYCFEKCPHTVYISVRPESSGMHIELYTVNDNGERIIHLSAFANMTGDITAHADLPDINNVCDNTKPGINGQECYEYLAKRGIKFGELYKGISILYSGDLTAVAKCSLSEKCPRSADYLTHPVFMDAALQTLTGMNENIEEYGGETYVPFSISSVTFFEPFSGENCITYATGGEKKTVSVLSEDGKLVAELYDVVMLKISKSDL